MPCFPGMLLQTLADSVGVGASYGQDDALDGDSCMLAGLPRASGWGREGLTDRDSSPVWFRLLHFPAFHSRKC